MKSHRVKPIQERCWENEQDKGFHDGTYFERKELEASLNVFYRKVSLTGISEFGELIETIRDGTMDDDCDKFDPEGIPIRMTKVEEEIADIQIRLFTLAEFLGVDALQVAEVKHCYNLTRPHMHNKNS